MYVWSLLLLAWLVKKIWTVALGMQLYSTIYYHFLVQNVPVYMMNYMIIIGTLGL